MWGPQNVTASIYFTHRENEACEMNDLESLFYQILLVYVEHKAKIKSWPGTKSPTVNTLPIIFCVCVWLRQAALKSGNTCCHYYLDGLMNVSKIHLLI